MFHLHIQEQFPMARWLNLPWKHLAANHTSLSEVGLIKQTAQFFFQASVVTTLKAMQATV